VTVTGDYETRALLARFEPDLLKRLNLRTGAIARNLKAGAEANFSRTGASGGFRIRTRNRVAGFSKSVTTQPGSISPGEKWSSEPGVLATILEFANGVRDSLPQNVKRTQSLIATLNARYGPPGRNLWHAWDQQKGVALPALAAEVKAVEDEYTARLR
jgi:hypothetical protein